MRDAVKGLVRLVALIAVTPALISFALRARVIGPNRALVGSTQALGLLPGLIGVYLRRAFLSKVIAECSDSATVEFGVLFSQVGTRIGDRAYIGPRCHIGLAHIEKDVLLAAGVHVPSGAQTHGASDPTKPIRDQEGVASVVRIGEGTWVGSAAVVMADVGEHSIVGAGAVVTKPLPAFVVGGGVPARVLKSRVEPSAAGDVGAQNSRS